MRALNRLSSSPDMINHLLELRKVEEVPFRLKSSTFSKYFVIGECVYCAREE